jgi:hypothetical protein
LPDAGYHGSTKRPTLYIFQLIYDYFVYYNFNIFLSRPSPTLNHDQLPEHLVESAAVTEVPPEPVAPPATSVVPPPASITASTDDYCGSSIASGSSGFGSLPKKRPALFGSELLNHQTHTSIMSTDIQVPGSLEAGYDQTDDDLSTLRGSDEYSEAGSTLQRQRSGSDMLDGCSMSRVYIFYYLLYHVD